MVDTGIGHHKAEPVLDDQQSWAMAHHPSRLGQHYFHKARVLVGFGGQRMEAAGCRLLYPLCRLAVMWMLEDDAEEVMRERRTLRPRVESLAQAPSDVDGAELIYGELVANTIRHARGAVQVRLELEDSHPPVLVVRDHGPGVRHRRPVRPDPYAESGRGLAIVETLAERIEELAGCTLVIEAAPERLDLKREIVARLSELLPTEASIASNTSSILISSLASAAR